MKNNPNKNEKKFPKGHFLGMWMGIGVAIFTGIGVPLCFATKNPGLIGIGPAIGVGFGLSVGQAIENKYEKEGRIRPLTETENKKRKYAVMIGTGLLILGVLAFILILFNT